MINPTELSIDSLPSFCIKQTELLPSIPALYFCSNPDKILYIGITTNLNDRWKRHYKFGEVVHSEGVKISWLALDPNEIYLEIEADFIEHYKPKLNRKRSKAGSLSSTENYRFI